MAKRKNPMGKLFVPAKWVVKEAFTKIMESVTIDRKTKVSLLSAYYEALETGSPRKEHTAVYEHLRYTGWDWEVFRTWERQFDINESWPYLFSDYVKIRDTNPAEAEYQLAGILTMFISAKASGLLRFYQGEDAAESSIGVYNYKWIAVTEVDFQISNQHADKFNRGELLDLPPFFPGDTCRLKHVRTRS
jgi:hypothetical protein